MTTDLAVRGNNQIETGATVRQEQIELLKNTICKGATDNELALFVQVANRTGLDPFARQIHAVKRNEYDPDANDGKGGWTKKMTIQTGIDGYRLIAERTGRYDGQRGPLWCDDTGEWRDVWLADAPPSAAKVEVYKAGIREPISGVATWREYAQRKKGGELVRMWQSMPAHMLAKCAEALALRKAFPQELSGVYTDDEIATDEVSPGPVQVTRTPAGPGAATSVPELTPTMADIRRIRTVDRAKELVHRSNPAFRALVPRAISAVFLADPHQWWDSASNVDDWKQVLEYAVELYDQQQYETSGRERAGSDAELGEAGDSAMTSRPDSPEGGDVVAGD